MRVAPATALAVFMLAAVWLRPAAAEAVLLHADFEATLGGWSTSHDVVIDVVPPGPDGASAAWLSATGLHAMRFTSPFLDATPGTLYAADAWLFDNDNGVEGVSLSMEFFDTDGGVIYGTSPILIGGNAASFRSASTGFEVAPPGATWLRVVVNGTPSALGARYGVDGVVLTESVPDEPVFEPEPPSPAPVATPVATPRPTATPRPRPTATPRPAPAFAADGPANADFEGGVTEWEVSRGRMTLEQVLDGFGTSLVLTATGTTTAWVEQRLAGVLPGGWYEASVVLAPFDGVDAAWLRIAWYASDDASGEQIGLADSPVVVSPPPNAIAQAFQVVGTGPVRAPDGALSARVRILLRPTDAAGASVAIDAVRFGATDPVEPAPPVAPAGVGAPPPAAPVATPTPAASPVAIPRTGGASASPRAEVGSPATSVSAEVGEAQRWLRISELMPDPAPSGADSEYEWLEIVNLGSGAVSTEGMSIRDNRTATLLPAITLAPGEAAVVGAQAADVVTPWRVPVFGNGLGNAGDTVALVTADGVEVDRVVYGEAPASEGVPVLPPPGAGRSIERWFDDDGRVAGVRATSSPSPGRYVVGGDEVSAYDSEAADGPTEAIATAAGASGSTSTWVVLIALAAGLLGGAVAQWAGAAARGRGPTSG